MPQTIQYMGGFHEPILKLNPGDSGAQRHKFDPPCRILPGRIRRGGGYEQNTLMQDAIVPEVVRKGQWNTRVGRREYDRGTGQAEWRRIKHPLDKLVFALAQCR